MSQIVGAAPGIYQQIPELPRYTLAVQVLSDNVEAIEKFCGPDRVRRWETGVTLYQDPNTLAGWLVPLGYWILEVSPGQYAPMDNDTFQTHYQPS